MLDYFMFYPGFERNKFRNKAEMNTSESLFVVAYRQDAGHSFLHF